MVKKLLLLGLVAAMMGLAFTTTALAEDLLVGIMVPTTGSEATYGKDMENAISLAVQEINAKGGVLGMNIATTTGDAACDPQQATAAANKLVSANVIGVVGGYCSGATLPTLKIYSDANVPLVIPAANSTKLIGANQEAGFKAFMINSTGFDQVASAVDLFTKRASRNWPSFTRAMDTPRTWPV